MLNWLGLVSAEMIADTNILLRAVVRDDAKQARMAEAELAKAERIVVPITTLCEFAWVLSSGYRRSKDDIAKAVRGLLASAKVVTNRPVAEAGIAMLEGAGDFADGVIACDGVALGGQTFVSFDKDAIKLLKTKGYAARVPG